MAGTGRPQLTRRAVLALGAVALPAAAVWRGARAQDFRQIPIPPDAARTDPYHAFWERMPREFPLTGRHYFNTAGMGIQPYEVLARTQEVALEAASAGETLRATHLGAARAAVARFTGADAEEIALTRNTTEGMNIVARGLRFEAGDEVILTTHEHPGGAAPWVALAQDAGIVLRLYEPTSDPGRDAEAIWNLAGKRTRGVVVSHVLATTGYILPVAEICAEARRRSLWCAVDGAQAAGIVPLDLGALGADFYAASGHKWLLGPIETGFLYVRRDRLEALVPRFVGAYSADAAGYSLEESRLEFLADASKFEYGTRSPAQAAGLAQAIEWLEGVGADLVRSRATALSWHFHSRIADLPGVEVLTPPASSQRVPIVTFRVPRRPNTQVQAWLAEHMHVRARTVGERGLNAVRVSFHLVNRLDELEPLIEGTRILGA